MKPRNRIIFMGTPEFACPSLSALAAAGEDIVGVITQPDRPSGRGRKMMPPPVKLLAQELGLKVWQPEKIRDPEVIELLQSLKPDLFTVIAFGQILNKNLIELPAVGCINVHASLLPAYRGPAPINWAIINGEDKTGVTTMMMDVGVDTGPMLMSKSININQDETAGTLHDKLSVLGAELLVETLTELKAENISPTVQPDDGISRAPLLKKSDGVLDWTEPAEILDRLVRGLDPWPAAQTTFKGKPLKLFGSRVGPVKGKPGQVLGLEGDRIHVAAAGGSLAVSELQLAGQKRLSAKQFWHGQRFQNDIHFFGNFSE